jgi:hypothetical protein
MAHRTMQLTPRLRRRGTVPTVGMVDGAFDHPIEGAVLEAGAAGHKENPLLRGFQEQTVGERRPLGPITK